MQCSILRKPFYFLEWSWSNFSFRYKHLAQQTGHGNEEIYQLEDIIWVKESLQQTLSNEYSHCATKTYLHIYWSSFCKFLLARWDVFVSPNWLLWILWCWFLCPIQVPFYLRKVNGTRGAFLTYQTCNFFLFFVSPLSVKHSDKLISGFFRMWKCCLSMEKWNQNGIKYLIALESLKGTSTCQILLQNHRYGLKQYLN